MMFRCEMCGECCRHLDQSDLYKNLDRGDGICKYLKNSKCVIYNNRPLLCRIDESYEKLFKDSISKAEYYRLNYEACDRLINLKEG